MKAMIFAAGRGERLRPLTDAKPKVLLNANGRPLIVWHILNLVRHGITDIVINTAHLGHMIPEALGDGSKFGANIAYSHEGGVGLETAGGVAYARHLLGEEPFIAVSGDVYCPYFKFIDMELVLKDTDVWGRPYDESKRDMAWIYLIENPPGHPQGDFALDSFTVKNEGDPKWTFAGIGVFRMEMFDSVKAGEKASLGSLLRKYAAEGRVGGEIYRGELRNINTAADLDAVNARRGRQRNV